MLGETQCKLASYSETLKAVLWFYGSIIDGRREVSEDMKKALQTTIKELNKAILGIVKED